MYNLTPAPEALAVLVPLYNSPGRHYHDLDHIHYLLHKLTEFNSETHSLTQSQLNILMYSIWFHDAIYSPFPFAQDSNERQSALLFKHIFNEGKIKDLNFEEGEEVNYNIKMTEYHLTDLMAINTHGSTTKIMLDLDLVGFAKPFHLVYNDSAKIFREYEVLGLDLDTLLTNRIKFLQALLAKPRIFYTDYFYDKYEATARSNIQEVIERSQFELGNPNV